MNYPTAKYTLPYNLKLQCLVYNVISVALYYKRTREQLPFIPNNVHEHTELIAG